MEDKTCKTCGKILASRKSRLAHENIHSDKRMRYTCWKCKKDFAHPYQLQSHLKHNHDIVKHPALIKTENGEPANKNTDKFPNNFKHSEKNINL